MKSKKNKQNNTQLLGRRFPKIIKVDLKMIRENYGPEVAEEFAKLYREMLGLKAKIEEYEKSAKTAWAENKILKSELEALRKEKEILETNLERLRKMYEEKVRQANTLLLTIEDLRLRTGIAESNYATLLQYIGLMKKRMTELMAEGAPEIIRKELQTSLAFLMEQINQVLNTLRGGVVVRSPIEGEEKKS